MSDQVPSAAAVRDRIEDRRKELAELFDSIAPDELSRPGPDGGWSVKDHMVHVAAWEHWLLALLDGRDVLEAMGAEGAGRDVDAVNAAVWERHRHDSVAQARAYFDEAHQGLMRAIDRLTTEDLQRPYEVFFDPGAGGSGREPLLVAVAANTYDHYAEHIDWIRSTR